jgi:hypothetical protein
VVLATDREQEASDMLNKVALAHTEKEEEEIPLKQCSYCKLLLDKHWGNKSIVLCTLSIAS